MKKGNKSKHKRLYKKQMRKRNLKKMKEPQIQWLTDTMFVIYFDDGNINDEFSLVTVEIVCDDCDFTDHNNTDTKEKIELN